MEILKINKDELKTIDEILAQNRMVLKTNYEISQLILSPPVVIDASEGLKEAKIPKAGEVIYK